MRFRQLIHTPLGEDTRIVINGFPEIKGNTMMDNYDHIRKLLMNEPRGHKDMFGAILTEPTNVFRKPNCIEKGCVLHECIRNIYLLFFTKCA